MSLHSETLAAPPPAVALGHANDEAGLGHVEADLNYLAPIAAKPYSYAYEPPAGVPRTNRVYAAHRMRIHDARPLARSLSLDREGFALIRHRTAMRDFDDEAERRRVYDPEMERLVAAVTGASRVVVFDHTIRRRLPGVADRTAGEPRQPVPQVHNDYTVKSGPSACAT